MGSRPNLANLAIHLRSFLHVEFDLFSELIAATGILAAREDSEQSLPRASKLEQEPFEIGIDLGRTRVALLDVANPSLSLLPSTDLARRARAVGTSLGPELVDHFPGPVAGKTLLLVAHRWCQSLATNGGRNVAGECFVQVTNQDPKPMTDPTALFNWEERYRNGSVEAMPWYWPSLDRDLAAALARYGISSGSVLDQGTGAGTQAIALAERGFSVTGTDVAAAAIEYAARNAKARGVDVTFVEDSVLATKIRGPFDVIFDRGCLHVLAPADRPIYVETIRRLLAPEGWLFLKTFSHLQRGTGVPHRFTPDDIRRLFGTSQQFEVVEILDTDFEGQLATYPKALFAAIRPT